MAAYEIAVLSGIVVVGFACQWVAWRLKLPAILFLLIAGILAGPVLGWFDPEVLLGDLLTPVVSIAVAIILFEGSLTLKLPEIRGHGSVVRNLVSIGVVVTWICGTLASWLILDVDIYLSALFGAIVTVSGPTVVMPLLRSVRPSKTVSSVLRWESILIDPLGAILALLVFDVIVTIQTNAELFHVAQTVATIVVIGAALGIAGGHVLGIAIRRRVIPDLLREFSALAAVLAVFAIAESVQSESGLLAVTLMGVWLGNMPHVELEDVLSFKETVTTLLISTLFIILAAQLDLSELVALGTGALAILAFLQLVAGPLRAFVSAAGSSLEWRERLFVGWVFPRGIVAAAISSLFALRLVEIGYPDADLLVPMVFSVIVGTVVVQSATARAAARLLDVSAPEPTGVLIVGSNPVARFFAKALREAGKIVLVADSHWAGIRSARMLGLPVFYGSPVSRYAEDNLDLSEIGTLLATSRRPGLNELACTRFAGEFGRDHVYVLGNDRESSHEKHMVSGATAGRLLFSGDHTIESLLTRVKEGAAAKTTELSDEYDFAQYCAEHQERLVIFAIDDQDKIRFPAPDTKFQPAPGWRVIAVD
jgi:CPA1 family monovalent cation:H+ antiporter